MNYNKKTIMDVDVAGKKILLRCDFNVPQDKETHAITSDKRIVASLPTIRYLLERGAAVIACSHLGKPKGQWKDSLTLRPVAERLSQLLGQEVIFAKDIVGEDAKAKAAALQAARSCCWKTCALTPARRRTTPSLPGSLPLWQSCMFPMPSAPCTGPTPPPPVWQLPACRVRPAGGPGAGDHGRCSGKPQASLCGRAGRGQGVRQDRRHQQPAGKGRHHHHRRRHGLYLCPGPGRLHRQEPVRAG